MGHGDGTFALGAAEFLLLEEAVRPDFRPGNRAREERDRSALFPPAGTGSRKRARSCIL